MEDAVMVRDAHILGRRIPLLRSRDTMDVPSPVSDGDIPSRVVARGASTATSTDPCDNPDTPANLCEKPSSGTSMALPVALGVCIPIVAIIAVLLYLHYRVGRKAKQEDDQNPHKNLDFGLDDAPVGKGAKANRMSVLGGREKDHPSRYRQMSMDLNLSSPYLLPPALHSSRESMHSLARSLHQGDDDPYRPVAQLTADGASSRSPSRGPDGGSIYSSESRQQRRSLLGPNPFGGPQGPRQSLGPKDAAHRKPQPMPPRISTASPAPSFAKDPFRSPSERSVDTSSYPDEQDFSVVPTDSQIREPAPAAHLLSDKALPQRQDSDPNSQPGGGVVQQNRLNGRIQSQQATIHERGPSAIDHEAIRAKSPPQQLATLPVSPPTINSSIVSPQPQHAVQPPVAAPIQEEPLEYYDDYAHMPESNYDHQEYNGYEDDRGRTQYRESSYYEPEQHGQTGLEVPQQDARRLSVGVRPLPSDEVLDTEDPETRANRIRSFYKEYFDDSKDPNGQPRQFSNQPMPPLPQQYQQQQQQPQQQHEYYPQGGNEYYEDYGHDYAAGAEDPYYDPSSNAFVMPYAQPVARRAMTPPPSGSRFQGPRAPPRGYHGSMGDMNMGMQGNPGPPRPGSSSSRQGPPRPGTAQSSAWGRPRAESSLSAYGRGRNGPPRKQLPPPADLSTLPTPSKLKDDSFALFNALDFAPPETYKDRAAGRSQSPMGERRAYQAPVQGHSPLINAFEEMPSLPSPHSLVTSSTFTGLDFAPPRKFADPSDNRSETGSIRSNRSGISAVQLGAIRNGAGRVSKLPGDTIFTQAAMEQKLKPNWTMRD